MRPVRTELRSELWIPASWRGLHKGRGDRPCAAYLLRTGVEVDAGEDNRGQLNNKRSMTSRRPWMGGPERRAVAERRSEPVAPTLDEDGNFFPTRSVLTGMRLGFVTFVTFVLLIATAIFACGGDELPADSDPPTQLQEATEPSVQQADEERPSAGRETPQPTVGRSAESGTDAETVEIEKESPPEDSSGDETAIQEPEREAEETRDATLDAEVEDAEPEPEEEPDDLTNVPAVVMEDAEVRVRPGLSWRVIDRLSAGEAVVVLNAASGWFRISFGDDREGWIRKPALDLGEVDPWWILKEPAPAIVAEWQGAHTA